MNYCTSNTYKLKRKIVNFSKKLSENQNKPDTKFNSDMIYGVLASASVLLTDIADKLKEDTKKINTVERLSRHLNKGISEKLRKSYLNQVKKLAGKDIIIHIDDSDVIKPKGQKFESLGIVRDGSASSKSKNIIEKGYNVTEATVLSKNNHPVSVFSHIHSSTEKGYKSTNTITYKAIDTCVDTFKKATFVMDRGYDSNDIFLKLESLNQDYVIRLTKKRKVFYKNKFYKVTQLCNRRKGKIKLDLFYKNKKHTAYLSHVKVKITASKKDVFLVLIYGITKHPMMLVTNKEIKDKNDVINIAKTYFSRWKIEEYFRCKKQEFNFENFRVRSLKSINALNFYISVCMMFLELIGKTSATNEIKNSVLKSANPIKEKVHFLYYRIKKGIFEILSYAKEGIKGYFKVEREKYKQLSLLLN